ncbi:MAG: acetoacetate--CoA ligase [Planctomycetota bacterium]|jgi:acetoacetyl-CoA synthetase
MTEKLWQPSAERIKSTQLTHFIRKVQQKYGIGDTNYSTLHQWSISNPAEFWEEVWQDCNIVASAPYTSVIGKRLMPGTKWFDGARLNYAENLLRYRELEQEAIIFVDERQRSTCLSFKELAEQVARCAAGLRELGVGVGDRVAAVVPNCPEAVIAALAASSIGAIWSSCSPDFGLSGIYDRLGQISPKVLITANAYYYNGKEFDCLERIKGVLGKIASIQKVAIIQYTDTPYTSFPKGQAWEEFIDQKEAESSFEQLPFDHPLSILYSSGTTGIPKSIVHGAGGTLIQHVKEHRYHCDLRPGDRLFYFTTCGWMMWNWLISGLASGATIVLYDGSPGFPDIGHLWEILEKWKITHFGTSPKFLDIVRKADYLPKHKYSFDALRLILSTGSPLSVELFKWVYENVKADVQLASISGGTDIVSCFVLGSPNLPVYAGEIQAKGLGMDVHAYDEQGDSVIGKKGELVCTTPFPSMPIHFWNDKNGEKYRKAYFDKIPGVWVHGDFIEITPGGGVIIYGRSDTTLNPGGVRIGTAEIYRPVEKLPEILDSIVIGKKAGNDIKIILFVVLKEELKLDDNLRERIKAIIRQDATPRHVPKDIYQVSEIPRTINGKKVEKAVTQIFHGERVLNTSVLLNPHALKDFEELVPEV